MAQGRSPKPKTRAAEKSRGESQLDLSHLRRDARTALELAIVALAPGDLIERLAAAAGMLEAIAELPPTSAPALALAPTAAARARTALDEWRNYDSRHVRKALA